MTGVNELAEEWDTWKFLSDWRGRAEPEDCAEQLREAARTAWHPVSEPPTEDDAGYFDEVIWYCGEAAGVIIAPWDAPPTRRAVKWARIRDVVLLPQSTGDEA